MLLLISADNLIALYLGLELMSLALYVLAAFRGDDGRPRKRGSQIFFSARVVRHDAYAHRCSTVFGDGCRRGHRGSSPLGAIG